MVILQRLELHFDIDRAEILGVPPSHQSERVLEPEGTLVEQLTLELLLFVGDLRCVVVNVYQSSMLWLTQVIHEEVNESCVSLNVFFCKIADLLSVDDRHVVDVLSWILVHPVLFPCKSRLRGSASIHAVDKDLDRKLSNSRKGFRKALLVELLDHYLSYVNFRLVPLQRYLQIVQRTHVSGDNDQVEAMVSEEMRELLARPVRCSIHNRIELL